MGCMHIIAVYVLLVFLIALIPLVIVREKEEKLRKDRDFIQVFLDDKEKMLERSSVPVSVNQYLLLGLLSAMLIGSAVFLFVKSSFLAVLFGILGAFIPDGVIRLILYQKNKKFDENFAKALEQMASSLKAGLSIQLAVKDVVDSPFIDESLRRQFSHISSDIQMGRSIQEAFLKFAGEVRSPYADDVALSIDIQNETGGHEAEVIKDIADGIRERILLGREIKSIFNETVLTIRVIQVLAPLSMTGMLLLVKNYREIYLENGVFTAILVILVGMEIAGVVVDNTMIRDAGKGK